MILLGIAGTMYHLIRRYKAFIFCVESMSVVLYGCEIWPLTLEEEFRFRVFENKVLRRIFRPKRNEVRGE
jgi:hypothetical protein